jgi:hypothetical protein
MTEIISLGLAGGAGIVVGAGIAGMVLLEHSIYFVVCIRMPASLHTSLKRAARANHVALSTEVLDRLMTSVEVRS